MPQVLHSAIIGPLYQDADACGNRVSLAHGDGRMYPLVLLNDGECRDIPAANVAGVSGHRGEGRYSPDNPLIAGPLFFTFPWDVVLNAHSAVLG